MLYLEPCNDGEGHVIERLASEVYRSAACVPSLMKRVEGYLSPLAKQGTCGGEHTTSAKRVLDW